MRYLLILLFISFNAFSQTYDELISIDSEHMFKKIVIENGYTKIKDLHKYALFNYAYNYDEDTKRAAIFAYYSTTPRTFHFSFALSNDDLEFK